MTRARIIGAACTALLLLSCAPAPAPQTPVASSEPGAAPPAHRFTAAPQPMIDPQRPKPVPDPPEPTGTAEELAAGSALGMPRGLNPNAQAAYWIWHGPQGAWHLRTTTGGSPQHFAGRILGISGDIVEVKPLREERKDRLRQSRRGLVFDFQTRGDMDGIDFRPSDNGCVRFNLRVAREAVPKRIFVGAGNLEPKDSHFMVCPGS